MDTEEARLENPEDFCPKCGAEIELSEGGDGYYYIYCPTCGPIPELAHLAVGCNKLGFPPYVYNQEA